MKRTQVEIACRYYFPDADMSGRWGWQRHRQTLPIEIPERPGEEWSVYLPPPFYGYNAAVTWRLEIRHDTRTPVFAIFDAYGSMPVTWTEWRETALWSQVKFDTFQYVDRSVREDWQRGPWWFRYRTPSAPHDILTTVSAGLNAIHSRPDDPYMVMAEVDRIRRSIIMHQLDEPEGSDG